MDNEDTRVKAFDDPAFDPFACYEQTRNLATADPYPIFARLRAAGPVLTLDEVRDLAGEEGLAQCLASSECDLCRPTYFVFSWEAAHEVDHGKLSVSNFVGSQAVMGKTLMFMDPPEHRTYRALVQHAFTRKALDRWTTELVDPLLHQQIDEFVDRGSADLVSVLTMPFPIAVVCALFGVPEEDVPLFRQWCVGFLCFPAAPNQAVEARMKMAAYLDPLIEDRRSRTTDDMIGLLAQAEVDGVRLTNEDIVSFCRMTLFAGSDTTYRSTGLLLNELLQRPETLQALRADRSLIPQAIEELLRYETVLQRQDRVVTADMDVAGRTIPAGSNIIVMLGSANRDETRWPAADTFDVFREPKPSIVFGNGPHTCLGMHLARLENREFLKAVFDRLPRLRFDEAFPMPRVEGAILRAVDSLPTRWD